MSRKQKSPDTLRLKQKIEEFLLVEKLAAVLITGWTATVFIIGRVFVDWTLKLAKRNSVEAFYVRTKRSY
jgi:hypothetical protein